MADIQLNNEVVKNNPDLNRFFYLSFLYSQGGPMTQREFFRWASKKDIFKDYPSNLPVEFQSRELPKMHKTFLKTDINEEFEGQWTQMVAILSNKELKNCRDSDMISAITEKLLSREVAYLKDKGGRPFPKESLGSSIIKADPYKSYLREHAVLGKPTGHPVFDDIFKEVGKVILEGRNKKDTDVLSLETLWEIAHPGASFFEQGGEI